MLTSEATSLREEILNTQSRKFTVFASVLTFIALLNTAILSQKTGVGNIDWRLLACIFYVVLAPAARLTWEFGRSITKIATYLQVSEGSQWEKAQCLFLKQARKKKIKANRGLNQIFGLLYFAIGIASIALAGIKVGNLPAVSTYNATTNAFIWILFLALTLFFIDSILKLSFHSYPRDDYERIWNSVLYSDN